MMPTVTLEMVYITMPAAVMATTAVFLEMAPAIMKYIQIQIIYI